MYMFPWHVSLNKRSETSFYIGLAGIIIGQFFRSGTEDEIQKELKKERKLNKQQKEIDIVRFFQFWREKENEKKERK